MPELKVAIFAWTGTVVNSTHWAYDQGMRAVFEHYGVALPPFETYLAEISRGFGNFCRTHGIPAAMDWRTPVMIYESHLAHHRTAMSLRSGMRTMLSFCHARDIKIAIIDGGLPDEIYDGINHLKLAPVLAYAEPIALDTCNVFKRILGRFQADPTEALYIGGGVRALSDAKELEIASIAMAGGFEQSEKKLRACSDHFVRTPGEALLFLKKSFSMPKPAKERRAL